MIGTRHESGHFGVLELLEVYGLFCESLDRVDPEL